jgi:hypothetical protein
MTDFDKKALSRRSFLRTGALAGGAAAGSVLAAPAVLAQAPLVVKMQTSWPARTSGWTSPANTSRAWRRCRAAA